MPRRGKGKKVDTNPQPFIFDGIEIPREVLINVLASLSQMCKWGSMRHRSLRGQVLNDPIGVGRFLVNSGYLVSAFKIEAKINQGEIPHVITRCQINQWMESEKVINENWSTKNEVGQLLT